LKIYIFVSPRFRIYGSVKRSEIAGTNRRVNDLHRVWERLLEQALDEERASLLRDMLDQPKQQLF